MRFLVLAAVGLLPLSASAAPSPSPSPSPSGDSHFLSANPHVPLAVVHNGEIKSAVSPKERGRSCGERRRWAKSKSQWRAVDGWGRVVGTYAAVATEAYDVTACFELAFESPPPKSDNLLFVAADSGWTESKVTPEWQPSQKDREAFATLLASTIGKKDPQDNIPKVVSAVPTTIRFFRSSSSSPSSSSKRMAVGGRCGGWLIAELDDANGAVWKPVAQNRAPQSSTNRQCYRPLAVFDMNGDGDPEIVFRFTEGGGEWWGEEVMQRSATDGKWHEVALSPGGSTA